MYNKTYALIVNHWFKKIHCVLIIKLFEIDNLSDDLKYIIISGRVRVNEAHVVTHNVPATNGVLHAIDGVL